MAAESDREPNIADFQHFDGADIVASRRNDAKVGMVVHSSSLDTREADTEGSGVQGHPI